MKFINDEDRSVTIMTFVRAEHWTEAVARIKAEMSAHPDVWGGYIFEITIGGIESGTLMDMNSVKRP